MKKSAPVAPMMVSSLLPELTHHVRQLGRPPLRCLFLGPVFFHFVDFVLSVCIIWLPWSVVLSVGGSLSGIQLLPGFGDHVFACRGFLPTSGIFPA